MKKRIMALMIAAALAIIHTGCTNGGGQSTQTPVSTTLNVGIAQELDDVVDPHRMVSAATRDALFNIYEGLVKPASDGSLVPAVAESYTVEGSVFTFKLREGVLFHNGAPVTAEDVVYSVSRAAGLDGGEAPIPALAAISSVEAPDDSTIVISLGEPNLELLAYLTAAIIPANSEDGVPPAGTGPFMYSSRSPQENFVIDRFDGYWGEKKPYFEKVVYHIIDNPEALVNSLKSGAIDYCARLTYDQSVEVGEAFQTIPVPMNLVQAVYLNNAAAPFDNPDVRRALAHAINRQEIMDVLANGNGFPLGSSMYPALSKYFVPELVDMYEYDPELAKSLLAEAGYAEGFDFVIKVPSQYTPHVETATVVISQLEAIGVHAEIQLIEWTSWLEEVYGAKEYEATVIGFEASAMTARAMLERFASDQDNNISNFKNDEYDATIKQAFAETDDANQVLLYKRLQTILAEDCANLYIQDLCDFVVIRSDIKGFTEYPLYVTDMAALYVG